jgi:glycine cleavage system H lipoate-binding protein
MLAAELRTLRAPLEILTTSARMREAVEAVERCLEEIAGTLYDANRKYDSEPSLARNLLRQEGWYEKFRGPVEGYIEAAQEQIR